MELDYRLPIQFSVEGKMSLLIKISVLYCTLSFQTLISPINWICGRDPVQEALPLSNLILEINRGTSKFL